MSHIIISVKGFDSNLVIIEEINLLNIGHKKVPRMQHKNKKWGTIKAILGDKDDKLEISYMNN